MNSLCGISMVRNGQKYDYCFKEAVLSLIDVCDYVIVVFVESDDNTLEALKTIDAPNFKIIELPASEWDVIDGRERLSYITNIAIQEADRMGFEYVLYCQADEVVCPESYENIRKAINDNHEGYFIRRVNLWGNPNLQLNIPQNRLPCSNYVIRLAKVNCRAIDDAESLLANANNDYADKIKMIHYGFVRDKKIMKQKAIHMQDSVFKLGGHDPKLDMSDEFVPELWFTGNDLIPIDFEHPKVVQDWVNERIK